MKFVCSLIVVSDIAISRVFYEDLLGQKVKYDFGENITFHGDFALHLKSHYSELIDHKEIRLEGNDFELYFESNDLDILVDKLRANNVMFVHELRKQPWQQLVVRFYDPDNHIVEVGESLDHLVFRLFQEGNTVKQIAELTQLSVEFINASIQCVRKLDH